MVSYAGSHPRLSPLGDSLEQHALRCGICMEQAHAAVGYLIKVAADVGRSPELVEVAFQSGCCGYLTALERYRPLMGTPFCAFACRFIKGAIMRGVGTELDPVCRGERMAPEVIDSVEGGEPNPALGVDLADIRTSVHRFLGLLPQGLQDVAHAVVANGLSQAQAARMHGMSRTAVMKKMAKVLGLAAVELGEYASN